MGGGKKAPNAYAGSEHSNIKEVRLVLGHVSLISKEKFWCKIMADGSVPPVADM